MSDPRQQRDEERRREAEIALSRVERESETVLRGPFEGASRARGEEDPIERLGRRIGRGAGFVAAAALLASLVWTYLL